MKIFLAGCESRHWIHDELLEHQDSKKKKTICECTLQEYKGNGKDLLSMQLYLAGVWPWRNGGGYDAAVAEYHPYILESFFYADEDTERLIPHFGDFLLDSGAFTFMQGRGGSPNWDEYVERYADFIKRNNIKKYFELDIDSVVGYEKVKRIRAKLERLTGRQSIPVWHKSRGKDEYIGSCKDYPYVAIGGLVDGAKNGEYARALWKYFPWFINTAHENGAKIHALGFTSLDGIRQYHFDSVDSTAWTTGNRFGYIYYFDGRTIKKRDAPEGHRISDPRKAALINFVEWLKFQKYADKHL